MNIITLQSMKAPGIVGQQEDAADASGVCPADHLIACSPTSRDLNRVREFAVPGFVEISHEPQNGYCGPRLEKMGLRSRVQGFLKEYSSSCWGLGAQAPQKGFTKLVIRPFGS